MSLITLSVITAANTRYQVTVNPAFVGAVEKVRGRDGGRAIVHLAAGDGGRTFKVAEEYHDVVAQLERAK